MQSNSLISEYNFPIYMEYEKQDSSKGPNYLLHISLPGNEQAIELFSLMKNRWSLPVSLIDNRIIISEEKHFGVIEYPQSYHKETHIFLAFQDEDHAEEFHDLIASSISNDLGILPIMTHETGFITFHDLLHPNFSIEKRKRIYDQVVDQFLISMLASKNFSDHFPNELSLLIGLNIFNLCFSNSNYQKRAIAITRQFKLPQNKIFQQLYKKIDCGISYSLSNEKDKDGNPQFKAHLICINENEAMLLKKNIENLGTRFVHEINHNEIIIDQLYYGVDYCCSNGIDKEFSNPYLARIQFMINLER